MVHYEEEKRFSLFLSGQESHMQDNYRYQHAHKNTVQGPVMTDTGREDLREKVLGVNDLVAYQPGTVASRMIVFKKAGSITIFSFDAGEGLSEHTAPYDAVLMVTDGKAEVQIAGTPFVIGAGEMIILPANKPHAVFARERFRMIFSMIRE